MWITMTSPIPNQYIQDQKLHRLKNQILLILDPGICIPFCCRFMPIPQLNLHFFCLLDLLTHLRHQYLRNKIMSCTTVNQYKDWDPFQTPSQFHGLRAILLKTIMMIVNQIPQQHTTLTIRISKVT